jgi:bifunctional non-homologous end joining protein LigD
VPRTAPLPAFVEPQLAKLVKAAPAGDAWLHEVKFDGYRILARVDRGAVRLLSRRGHDWTAQFPGVATALAALPATTALVDGEVAVVLADGRTRFQALQNALGVDRRDVVYFVFDLLHVDGEDWSRRPLDDRKARLAQLVSGVAGVRYSDHVVGRGDELFATACATGLEGIVSKRRDQTYQPGRGGGWVKTKCTQRQELVIGGFTDPAGSRVGLSALLVGHYRDGELVYAGKVGTGFSQKMSRELRARLEPLEQATSPFAAPPRGRIGRDAHWVRPELVAEVELTEWTEDGRARHPSFKGLRADKPAAEVVRDRPAPEGGVERAPRPARAARRAPARRRDRPTTRRRRGRPAAPRGRARAGGTRSLRRRASRLRS